MSIRRPWRGPSSAGLLLGAAVCIIGGGRQRQLGAEGFSLRPPALGRSCATRKNSRCTRLQAVGSGGGLPEEDDDIYTYNPEYPVQDPEMDFAGDEELLQRFRDDQQRSNDMWQASLFGEYVGEWRGFWSEYKAEQFGETTVLTFQGTGEGITTISPVSSELGCFEFSQKAKTDVEVPPAVFSRLSPQDMRPSGGAQVVGNAFTFGRKNPDTNEIAREVGMKFPEGDVRIRCHLRYAPCAELKPGTEEAQNTVISHALDRLWIVREKRSAFPDKGTDKALYSDAGKGIYDPPGETRSRRYYSIYTEGNATVLLPLKCMLEGPESICLDWTPEPGEMRYQADCRWKENRDGSLYSLELTEINAADADIYIPEIREYP